MLQTSFQSFFSFDRFDLLRDSEQQWGSAGSLSRGRQCNPFEPGTPTRLQLHKPILQGYRRETGCSDKKSL